MKRRNHWVLFAILLLALISLSPGDDRKLVQNDDTGFLASPPLPDRVVEAAPGPIEVAVQMKPEAFKLLQERNRIFMDSHQINVTLVNEYGKDVYALLKQQLALHEAPDVMLLDNSWIREFAVKGYLLPVDSYFTGAASGNSLGVLQASGEWNGYVWAVPKDMDPYVLVYKPETLEKLGFDSLPLTLEKWDKLNKAVVEQASQSKLKLIETDFGDPYAFLALFHRLGGSLSLKQGEHSVRLSEEDQKIIRFLEAVRPGLGDVNHEEGKPERVLDDVAQGQSVLALVPFSEFKTYAASELHAETPASPGAGGGITLFGQSFVVSSNTADPETAGRWITAMTEAAEQKDWFEQEGVLPALKSLYDASADAAFAVWLPNSGDKNVFWTLPPSESAAALLRKLSVQAGPFLHGEISSDAFIEQLSAGHAP